jgi:mono/diheme cytochrome c family protein
MHKAMLIASAAFLLASNACRKDGGTQTESAPATTGPATTAPAADAVPATPTEPTPAADAAPATPTEPTATADAVPATPPPAEPTPAADAAPAAPAIDAAALIAARCAACHSADRVHRQTSRDRAWWTGVVDKMIRNGARLDDAEKQALLDYLVNRPAN